MSRIFSAAELDGLLEAAFLIKPTGIQVAAWTRAPAPQEIIGVMAATMWGSLETMLRAMGSPGPRSALLEVDDRRMLAQRVNSNWTLLLIAPSTVGSRELERQAQRIVHRLARLREDGSTPRSAASSRA